jgi:hypothetical protein
MTTYYDNMTDAEKNMQIEYEASPFKKHLAQTQEGRNFLRSVENEMPFFNLKRFNEAKNDGFYQPIEVPTVISGGRDRVALVSAAKNNYYAYKNLYTTSYEKKYDASLTDNNIQQLIKKLTGKNNYIPTDAPELSKNHFEMPEKPISTIPKKATHDEA